MFRKILDLSFPKNLLLTKNAKSFYCKIIRAVTCNRSLNLVAFSHVSYRKIAKH